jgi:hypothetical protein
MEAVNLQIKRATRAQFVRGTAHERQLIFGAFFPVVF